MNPKPTISVLLLVTSFVRRAADERNYGKMLKIQRHANAMLDVRHERGFGS